MPCIFTFSFDIYYVFLGAQRTQNVLYRTLGENGSGLLKKFFHLFKNNPALKVFRGIYQFEIDFRSVSEQSLFKTKLTRGET